MDQLQGLIGETPRVVHAIATQMRDDKGNASYAVVAFIRHSQPAARCAMVESETSVMDAAKGMKTTLSQFGIEWNGEFRFVTRQELDTLKAEAAPATGSIIAS